MKRIPTFVAGMLTAAVIGGLGVGALAASGAVTFNASALQFNGRQISAKGENYTLDNGQQVPASITYTDETGGGTTYLPVRRIVELLGIEIGWDSATGSVTVTGDVKPTATPDPDTTTPSTDYSDWSAEEEAAYQEFKGMCEVSKKSRIFGDDHKVDFNGVQVDYGTVAYYEIACFKDDDTNLPHSGSEASEYWQTNYAFNFQKYAERFAKDLYYNEGLVQRAVLGFYFSGLMVAGVYMESVDDYTFVGYLHSSLSTPQNG